MKPRIGLMRSSTVKFKTSADEPPNAVKTGRELLARLRARK
jgi:hypothetical protein